MGRHEDRVASIATRVAAVAQFCGVENVRLAERRRAGFTLAGEHQGAPVSLSIEGAGSRRVRATLSTPLAGVPVELSLRPELAGESVDKALGMTVDVEVGDRVFDARFVVEAAPVSTARQLLVRGVREALLAIPTDHAFPLVNVGRDGASITLAREPDPMMLQHALDALALIRQRAVELHEGVAGVGEGAVFREVSDTSQRVDPSQREAARSKLRRARARAVVVLTSAAAAGIGFLATVILGHGV